jgi:CubicO group peptidase (beta-lactamase class C family)
VAVSISNVVCWSAGFGHADLEAKRPATGETIYRYASISKPIAATAVMQLVERGKVSLDTPVQKHVPDFPEKPEGTITARHLLTHTSGIRHYRGAESLRNRRYDSIVAGLEIFKDDPLEFKPGTKYHYSSYAYNVLAAVVEAASTRSFREYLKTEIFRPAGMSSADLEFLEEPQPNRCRQYARVGEQFVPAPTVDLSYKWAGGGMAGTAEDLVRFCIALDQDKLLKPVTRSQMYESATLTDGSRTGYGLGWRIVRDKQRHTWTAHSGGATGGTTYLLHNPSGQIAVALLSNAQGVKGLDALALRLGQMLLPPPLKESESAAN